MRVVLLTAMALAGWGALGTGASAAEFTLKFDDAVINTGGWNYSMTPGVNHHNDVYQPPDDVVVFSGAEENGSVTIPAESAVFGREARTIVPFQSYYLVDWRATRDFTGTFDPLTGQLDLTGAIEQTVTEKENSCSVGPFPVSLSTETETTGSDGARFVDGLEGGGALAGGWEVSMFNPVLDVRGDDCDPDSLDCHAQIDLASRSGELVLATHPTVVKSASSTDRCSMPGPGTKPGPDPEPDPEPLGPQEHGGSGEGRISTSYVATDNSRHFAYLPPDRKPIVVDTFSGRSTTIRNAKDCSPTDIRAGKVLLSCFARQSADGMFSFYSHRLASVRTGKSSRLGSIRPAILDVLGKYWAAGHYDSCGVSPHCGGDLYLNLRNMGVRKFGDTSGPRPDIRIVDQKSLAAELRIPDFPTGRVAVPVDWTSRNLVTDDGRDLTLWRPGKEPVRIGKAIGYCCQIPSFRSAGFGGGQFLWDLRGSRYRSIELSTLKRRTVRLPRRSDAAPIRGGVIVSTRLGQSSNPGLKYRIRVKRW